GGEQYGKCKAEQSSRVDAHWCNLPQNSCYQAWTRRNFDRSIVKLTKFTLFNMQNMPRPNVGQARSNAKFSRSNGPPTSARRISVESRAPICTPGQGRKSAV